MGTGRLEAFSDGVLAIIITIMVLDLHSPHEPTLASLQPMWPILVSYALSFIFVGIYWNNHHHLFQVTERVNGTILWANLHLLFWLSLIPFTTNWLGSTHFSKVPTALYGAVLLMSGFAYWILQSCIVKLAGDHSILAAAIGKDAKGKLSLLIYAVAIAVSFANRWIACCLYVVVAMIWLIPDRRIERTVSRTSTPV